ncbi:1,6-anhydro-N-acetylmuramyl-L-alanine amidase AmpD [Acidihalobacter ferrooxydans]|uniref:1,6-anhydro-N-acetylmuramyl-L-alanine amidase AmpD n=1 Tax=Acidihalobacter ferrooxydans TaxID=1765967 RepID=A0A1P8UFW7_9GAMM|nr:1,6-anhydro-N-acetylmuramyl-L-alanine amidase AmpD [Acidihalobacter ferrooxydans]APZ42747.1 N-acetylmuramoyl-L-alanine amidase [Acidihalobacter ferrooxydans]
MKIDAAGWLDAARARPSPNADERPAGCVPELIVVHNISLPPGEFGGPWIDALFDNALPADAHPYFADIAALRVSAHLLIRRDGALAQYVSFLRRAWHAGVSFYGRRARCNDFSIGIELEGADEVPYTDAQYACLAAVVAALLHTYPTLARERISGHADIAPGRKTDPGPSFDWGRLRRELGRSLASQPSSLETSPIGPNQ